MMTEHESKSREKILAAYDLLQGDLTTIQKFESVQILIRGASPKIDNILGKLSKIHSDISKLEQGGVVEFTAENLPDKTEKDKKRKKALLLFLKNWNQLKSEVERVRNEIEKIQSDSSSQNLTSATNILARAKGPLGIITIAAVVIVGVGLFLNAKMPKEVPQMEKIETSSPSQSKEKISPVRSSNGVKVIDFNGKKIPLSELTIGIGQECLTNGKPVEHYHALDHIRAIALDGTALEDPGGCGFGKVSDTKIEEI